MQIKKRLVALLAGISLICCGLFVACDNPSGVDKKDETEITNPTDKTDKTTDKNKSEDKNPSSDKDKTEDKQKDSGKENSTETDENNEKENAGEGDINGKENGGESEGEESVVAEETTLSVGDSSIVVKNTAEGIRFEWDKLPEKTEYIEIQTWWDEWRDYIAYYRCQNPSEVKSFTDEFVTADEEYKYKILFYSTTGLINKDSNEITIKAKGGKGELSINIEATEEGIKLSGVKYHESEDSMFGIFKNEKGHLIAGNPSSINSFTGKSFEYVDNFVDADTEYEYRAVEAFNGYIAYPRYKTQTVKAIGGLGSNQIKLTATPTEKGIKFAWDKIVAETDKISSLQINLNSTESKDLIMIHIHDKSALSFIAEYVDADKVYSCGMKAYLTDGTSLWSNRVEVTTSGGSGEGKLLNTPAATFDGAETIHFTVEPQISLPAATGASCDFEYCDFPRQSGTGTLYSYYPRSSDSDVEIWAERVDGTWNLSEFYTVHFNGEEYEYSNRIYDVSKLNNIPQTIILTAESRFSLIATSVSEGIKLEWKSLPEETKSLIIKGLYRDKNEDKYRDIFTLFEINNPSEINSVIDKYVDSGNSYSYKLIALDQNNNEIKNAYAKDIVAKSGSGEKKLTATAEADGIHLSFEKPDSDYLMWIYKRLSEKQRECHEWFDIGRTGSIPNAFTDSFVVTGNEYVYSLCLELKDNSSADIVEYPRYSSVHVKSISTGEKLVITNQPAGTYDEMTKTLTFTTKPEIASVDGVDIWNISLDYNRQSGASSGFGIFEIKENTDTCEAWSGAGNGTFYLCAYRIWSYFDNSIRYHVENSDISNLSRLPQSVKL